MRPTVIRLIVGGALGIAFSVSLTLPGAVVFPEEAPIRHLAVPDAPSTMVVRAAPVAAPKKAPAPRRVVVRPVYVPTIRTAPAADVVRHAPSRSRPSTKPVQRTSPPAQQRLTPLAAPPAPPEKAKKPKKAKRRSWERDERPDDARKGGRGRDDDEGEDGDDDEGGDDDDDDGDDDEGDDD